MVFQVKELIVALASGRIACGNTEAQCPTASALGIAAPDPRRNLELLRRDLAARSAN
jgi:hypothetical protein